MNRFETITLFDTLTWLVDAGLDGRSERGLTEGLAERLRAYGVPVDRIAMGSEVLDPVLRSRQFVWRLESGTEKYRHERGLGDTDEWLNSILHWMLVNNVTRKHLHLDDPEAQRYTLLPELKAQGFVDYYARNIPYGEAARLGAGKGLMATFGTRSPTGFSQDHIMTIETVLPAFSLAFMARSTTRTVGRVLSTYLGDRPAESILKGQIMRGEASTMEAVVWMSDIAGYTEQADHMRREGILEFLNVYAEIVADEVYNYGGEVLKFIGDGVLAVFESGGGNFDAAKAALDAAIAVEKAVAKVRVERQAENKPAAEVIIGLHHGKVLFGNFGSTDRLDFTALGSAVNEASRLVSLAKTLEQRVITSSQFRDQLGEKCTRLVSLGRYVLRSVSGAHHLYTVDPGPTEPPAPPAQAGNAALTT